MIQVVAGEQLIRAFAITGWREAEPGIEFDQVLDLTRAMHDPLEWMDVEEFTSTFGFDMLRHVQLTERLAC